ASISTTSLHDALPIYGDPWPLVPAEQPVRIVQLYGEADDISDGCQGDVELAEIKPQLDSAILVLEGHRLGLDGAASEPAVGSMSAKQGVSSPLASRGRYLLFWASVP